MCCVLYYSIPSFTKQKKAQHMLRFCYSMLRLQRKQLLACTHCNNVVQCNCAHLHIVHNVVRFVVHSVAALQQLFCCAARHVLRNVLLVYNNPVVHIHAACVVVNCIQVLLVCVLLVRYNAVASSVRKVIFLRSKLLHSSNIVLRKACSVLAHFACVHLRVYTYVCAQHNVCVRNFENVLLLVRSSELRGSNIRYLRKRNASIPEQCLHLRSSNALRACVRLQRVRNLLRANLLHVRTFLRCTALLQYMHCSAQCATMQYPYSLVCFYCTHAQSMRAICCKVCTHNVRLHCVCVRLQLRLHTLQYCVCSSIVALVQHKRYATQLCACSVAPAQLIRIRIAALHIVRF